MSKKVCFTKMQGLGNDYIYINCMESRPDEPEKLAVSMSDRHFGVGADGIILIEPSQKADFFMSVYNSDGSRAAMCGNGIRCFGKYVYEKGLTDKNIISIETLAGIRTLTMKVMEGVVTEVTVDMGSPIFSPEKIPVKGFCDTVINAPLVLGKYTYYINCVSMGNPHAVIFVDNVTDIELEIVGRVLENHRIFPERTNVEFVEVIDKKNLVMRVWERGSGPTLACGTGACASLVMAVLNGLANESANVHMLYGSVRVKWDRESSLVYLTGGADTVFEGDYLA